MDDEFFGRMFFFAEKVFGRKNFRPNVASTTVDAEVFFFKSFQKICPEGKFLEMVSWGGLGGRSPPQESPLPVPCPRALLPIFVRPNFFVRIMEPIKKTECIEPKFYRSYRSKAALISNTIRIDRIDRRLPCFATRYFPIGTKQVMAAPKRWLDKKMATLQWPSSVGRPTDV